MSRGWTGLGRASLALLAFALLLTSFLVAPVAVLGVFACALVAAERARLRR